MIKSVAYFNSSGEIIYVALLSKGSISYHHEENKMVSVFAVIPSLLGLYSCTHHFISLHIMQKILSSTFSAQVFSGCHSWIPPRFCNASIPERSSKSYYQYHQGMIDKRSESNISTYESKKAAVRSHIGSRTAACLLILYSFLSLGVRTTPDHKFGRAHLKNVASRWAKLKF